MSSQVQPSMYVSLLRKDQRIDSTMTARIYQINQETEDSKEDGSQGNQNKKRPAKTMQRVSFTPTQLSSRNGGTLTQFYHVFDK